MHEIDNELEKFTLPEPSIPMVNINTGLEFKEFYSSLPFSDWINHQQTNLFKLNKKTATLVNSCPSFNFQVHIHSLRHDIYKL